jgi:hypothetical protein
MKKIYLAPEMEVVKIEKNIQLLAGSNLTTGTQPTNPGSSDAPEFYW